MDGFIVPIILIIIALVSRASKNQAKNAKRGTPPQRTQKKQSLTDAFRDIVAQLEDAANQNNDPNKKAVPLKTQEKTKSVQRDRMQSVRSYEETREDRHQRPTHQNARSTNKMTAKQPMVTEVTKKSVKGLPIKNRLNKTGLRQSIIMSEVLGPPRAKKPHKHMR